MGLGGFVPAASEGWIPGRRPRMAEDVSAAVDTRRAIGGRSGGRSVHKTRGVRERPGGTYYAEIRSGDIRLDLGTFGTAHEAARAYDAATWRLERPPVQMNFRNVFTREQAQSVTPPPRLITDQDRAEHCRLLIAEETSEPWRSGAGATRRTSWRSAPSGRKGRQSAERSGLTGVGGRPWRYRSAISLKQVGCRFFGDNDPRCEDMWIDTSDNTSLDEDEHDSE
ncbi:uncharacterized protein [Aegilops tauschii subsp. strangulata]|uniref:uncharacterized protein n=1 Tax=Aegilops tauschii subsp. strangulata TaxID=200361 RepID=UPI00098A205C